MLKKRLSSGTTARVAAWVIAIICAAGSGVLAFNWRQANLHAPSGMDDAVSNPYYYRLWVPVLLIAAAAGALVLNLTRFFTLLQLERGTAAAIALPVKARLAANGAREPGRHRAPRRRSGQSRVAVPS